MRTLFLVVCLVLAGCGAHPKKTAPPRKPVTGVAPIGTERGTTPSFPAGSPKDLILAIANSEWLYFGKQKVVFEEDEESIPHVGSWEDDDGAHIDRVNVYWRAVSMPGLSGIDCRQPWSAAFISWVMRVAGVPQEAFPPAKAHWVYLSRLISRSHDDPDTAFLPRTIREYKPQPGDLICASRDFILPPDSNELPQPELLENTRLHCDIVVQSAGRTLAAIGGNVRNSVSKSILRLTPEGYLRPTQHRPWFLIVQNRLE